MGWLEPPGQRIPPDTERPQDPRRRIGDPRVLAAGRLVPRARRRRIAQVAGGGSYCRLAGPA